jgi:threonine dehydrogenase-like Zn-dependent dehydrogenase
VTDAELRALVRDAVARHFGGRAEPSAPRPAATPVGPAAPGLTVHASHAVYLTIVNTGDACVIEPAVSCTHCGYCRSHGH